MSLPAPVPLDRDEQWRPIGQRIWVGPPNQPQVLGLVPGVVLDASTRRLAVAIREPDGTWTPMYVDVWYTLTRTAGP